MWWSKMVVAQAPKVVGIDFVAVFVAVRLHLSDALALAWILGVAGMLFLVSGGVTLLASRWAGTKTLGVSLYRNMAPMDHEQYVAWCRRNGLVPFAAHRSRESDSA
jgi:hypothetical protein